MKLLKGRKLISGFATQKVLGLFCYFLDNGYQHFGREKLMMMFWGESPESQARYNLRYALWNIRKLLKEVERDIDPLSCSRTICQINPELEYRTDTREFNRLLGSSHDMDRYEALQKAIDIYKGPFLDGFTLRNLPEWEEWLFHRRESFHQSFINAAVELGNRFLNTDQASRAIPIFMRVLASAPDLEPAHDGLIRAYADKGRSSAALRQFNIYAKLMNEEYGAPPNEEIKELTDRLRDGTYVKSPIENGLEAHSINIPTEEIIYSDEPEPAFTPFEETESFIETEFAPESIPFIGRSQELESLQKIVKETASGKGQVVIISGEMGIGKTRLFEEFLRHVPKEFLIGIGESHEIGSSQPLEEFRRVLERFHNDSRLPDDLRVELQKVLNLQKQVQDGDKAASDSSLMAAIRNWIVSLAERFPVLIALDDMHWAGEALLNLFSALSQDARRLPLLLVGIFRKYELQSEDAIASSLISIARTGRLQRFELSELSTQDTIQLITGKGTTTVSELPEGYIERLSKFSCGIPLFVVELVNFLQGGQIDFLESPKMIDEPDFHQSTEIQLVPPLMLKIASLRMSQLGSTHVHLLRICSLLLGDFSIELTQNLLDLEIDVLEDMLVDLEHRNLLHHIEKGDSLCFAFNHLMIKLAIADTIPAIERRRIYKSIINSIDETGEECSAEARAYYLFNSGDKTLAIPYLMISSRDKLRSGNQRSGMEFSQTAYLVAKDHLLENTDIMVDVILEHADNLINKGLIKPAIDVLSEAIEKMEKSVGTEQINLLSRREEFKTLLQTEPALKDSKFEPLTLITTKRALSKVKLLAGDHKDSQLLLDAADKALSELPDTPETLREAGMILHIKARLKMRNLDFANAAVLLENAIELLKINGSLEEIIETLCQLSMVYRKLNKLNKAKEVIKQCAERCLSVSDPVILAFYNHASGMLQYDLNIFDKAEELLIEALRLNQGITIVTDQISSLLEDYSEVLKANGKEETAEIVLKELKSASDKEEIMEKQIDLKKIIDLTNL